MLDVVLVNYMVPVITVFIFSIICSIIRRSGSFSTPVFLTSFAIGFLILIWIPVLPLYAIIIPILIIIGMLFTNSSGQVVY